MAGDFITGKVHIHVVKLALLTENMNLREWKLIQIINYSDNRRYNTVGLTLFILGKEKKNYDVFLSVFFQYDDTQQLYLDLNTGNLILR